MTQRYRPGYERAAEAILEHVAREQLSPGDRLPTEIELSQRLGFSRTVTREAVRSLATLGRLSVRKGAGIFVATEAPAPPTGSFHLFLPADIGQVGELFELRAMLERDAGQWAALRATPQDVKAIQVAVELGLTAARQDDFAGFREADEQFHSSVAAAAHNRFLEPIIALVTQLRRQVVAIGLRGEGSGSLVAAAGQHQAVFDAIAAGDAGAAGEAMREHIDIALAQFQRQIQRTLFDADSDRA